MEQLIYVYTRKHALADGVQTDISEMARKHGFKVSVFITDNVIRACIGSVEDDDWLARIHALLDQARCAIQLAAQKADMVRFAFPRWDKKRKEKETIYVQIGPYDFDDSRPALTIMTTEDL